MKEAFTYMFKDTCFKNKAAAYFIICFLSSALLGYSEVASYSSSNIIAVTSVKGCLPLLLQILGVFVYLIVCGYYLNCINAIVKQQNNIVLPLLNIKNSLVKGLKFYISVLLLVSVFVVVCIATDFINKIFSTCVGILFLIFLGIYVASFAWIFAVENRITTFFRWRKVINLVKRNLKTYFLNYISAILLFFTGAFISYFIMYLLNWLCHNIFISYILSTIVDALLVTYTAFVGMYLIAKSIKPSDV